MPARPYDGPVIDAHHHIWRLADLPWLAGPPVPRIFGEYGPIRRDYLMEEYLGDVRPHGVVASVYVQANWPAERSIDEVRWVQSCADAARFPMGIVGYAELAAPDLARTLDGEAACRSFSAVRQQLHWHEQTLYRFASRPDWTNDPAWRRGLAEVTRRGLPFELQIFSSQMADAAVLARDFPDTTLVLMHAGMPEDRTTEGWARWRKGMQALAACPNVVTKLSGLGTFIHESTVAGWKPVVDEALALFGPARCIYGSNFPVEKLWTSYGALIGVMRTLLADLSADEQRAIFHDNAAKLYRPR
jgi:predicted TIM-barrel fold metal-dependent hydrolase